MLHKWPRLAKKLQEQPQAVKVKQTMVWVVAKPLEVKGGVAKQPPQWKTETPQLQMAGSAQLPGMVPPPV